jgi:HK97 family phage portal protein
VRVFGVDITFSRARSKPTAPARGSGGWTPLVREPYTGAWQRNDELGADTVLGNYAVFACVTLIASDIGKIGLNLVALDDDGIWTPTESPSFSPVLRKPNRYQTRIKFVEQWITSKLIHGNTYVLKQRDGRGLVVGLYVLDPCRVTPLVATDGAVFYELERDDISGLGGADPVAVPASEIIHDPMVCLFHPLIGVSPIYACGLSALQGIHIQENSSKFFANGSQPGGILTAPAKIGDDVADRLKKYWAEEFSGGNVGKVAVLGDGLTYEALSVNAADSQLIEQLKWSGETVCSCYHVPSYMVGIGPPPNYNNIEALNQQYYAQCLQALIEAFELCLDEGLELPKPYGTEFAIGDLLRMDTAAKVKAAADGIGAGALAPNEARKRYFDLGPVAGGDSPYLQAQNYSLEALAARDAADPFAKPTPPPPTPVNADAFFVERLAYATHQKSLAVGLYDA